MRKLLLILLILSILISAGCGKEPESSGQRLVLSMSEVDEGYRILKPEDLGGNYDEAITYHGVDDVTILLNGKEQPLEDAVSSGAITVEELIAFAQIDARNGICKLRSESEKGLTTFTYLYLGAFELRVRNDLYETPDGRQHLIRDVDIFNWGGSKGVGSIYTAEDGSLLDMEDWGLTFEVSDITPSGITLTVVQSGGQHFGTLQTNSYSLIYLDKNLMVQSSFDNMGTLTIAEAPIQITNDGTTVIPIDWSGFFQELPSGEYLLNLDIDDIYDPETVHPLARNYHDFQNYTITFRIQ